MPSPSTRPRSSESSPSLSPVIRFSPEEEASLLHASHAQKAHANTLYVSQQYSQAVGEYDKALASCPVYLDYDVAVLKANVAACHLQLREWQAAVEAATAALEALERLLPPTTREEQLSANGAGKDHQQQQQQQEEVVELDTAEGDADEEATAHALQQLEQRDRQTAAARRLRTKALLRRARAKSELGGWANLQGAEDDYKLLVASPAAAAELSAGDRRVVREALEALPGRIREGREREVGEMMGKLREVGDGILKPFGLSTDMFKVVKNEESGGYSMSFDQGR